MIGQTIKDRYRVYDKLGAGGFAAVYFARDTVTNGTVAVKALHPHLADDPQMQKRFVREAAVASSVVHPNVVRLLDYHQEGNNLFLVMEFVEGHTLSEVLRDGGQLPLQQAVDYSRQLLLALETVHSVGLIHRDIKPQNLMITPGGVLKLMDFGIARSTHAAKLTGTGVIVGTPDYMSPEQATGTELDSRSDLYSATVVFYEMLAGKPPFSDPVTPWKVLQAHASEPPPALSLRRPGLPIGLENFVTKGLAKQPAHRFQSAVEMLAALDAAVALSLGDTAPGGLSPVVPVAAAGLAATMATPSELAAQQPPRASSQGGLGDSTLVGSAVATSTPASRSAGFTPPGAQAPAAVGGWGGSGDGGQAGLAEEYSGEGGQAPAERRWTGWQRNLLVVGAVCIIALAIGLGIVFTRGSGAGTDQTAASPSAQAMANLTGTPSPTQFGRPTTTAEQEWQSLAGPGGKLQAYWGKDWAATVELLAGFTAKYPWHKEAKDKLYEARVEYGKSLASAGNKSQAAAQFTAAIELDPTRPEARAELDKLNAVSGTPRPATTATAPPRTIVPAPTATPTQPPAPTTSTPTPTKTPVPPSPTSTRTPTPTPTPTPACSTPVAAEFNADWTSRTSQLGCPTMARKHTYSAFETFVGGYMTWRQDKDDFYAVFNDKTWKGYASSPWHTGDPDFPCGTASSPPSPKRGFAGLWCSDAGLKSKLGNAKDAEWGRDIVVQDFQKGTMWKWLDTGVVLILYTTGKWENP